MIALAVLAAGGSGRFGSPKQLALIEGETLLHRATRVADEWRRNGEDRRALVILGANAEQLRAEVVDGVGIVINERWVEGLATSIHAAVHAAAGADALIIALADQPGVRAEDFESIARVDAPIVAAAYDGTVGVPALFRRERFAALLALHGDTGGKTLLRGADVATVSIPAAARDIDCYDDINN
jgi:CTP:molybdopterin cytidylyltransferase MocA